MSGRVLRKHAAMFGATGAVLLGGGCAVLVGATPLTDQATAAAGVSTPSLPVTTPAPPATTPALPSTSPTVSLPALPPGTTGLSSTGGLPSGLSSAASSALAAKILGDVPDVPRSEPPIAGAGTSPPPAPRWYVHDPGIPAGDHVGCNPLGSTTDNVCLYPFPSDYETRPDPTTPTGLRLNFHTLAMPRNLEGVPIDSGPYDTLDGFSPGESIIVKVPGLDTQAALARTGASPITNIAQTYSKDAPVVVINTKTGKRQLIWVEVDANAPDAADATVIIRPGVNFDYDTTYVVAMRDLRTASGAVIQPDPTFKALRDGTSSTSAFVNDERAHYNSIFRVLNDAGIARNNLYLAWDFTVGSWQSLTGRMLHIRNDAFAQLGDDDLGNGKVEGSAPKFTITKVTDNPDADIYRQIDGYFKVPCYLDTPRCVGVHSQFLLNRQGLPVQLGAGTPAANMMQVKFECRIPNSAVVNGVANPAHPSLYGHGLFGSYTEVEEGWVDDLAIENNFMFCATNWVGMAEADIPNAASALADLSNFPTLVDRLQQGFLNFLYLGRLMIHPDGFAANADFQLNGKSLINTSYLSYDGNSQGGIFGGTLTAISTDFKRAILGVPAMNYSTLLQRSTDFGTDTPWSVSPTVPPSTGDLDYSYAYPLYTSYPEPEAWPLDLALIQLIWDRADPDGYAARMTSDPLPDTPAHQVLMEIAFGDHQVSNWAAEVEARTIGAHLMYRDVLAPGRSNEVIPYYGITPFKSLPAVGSAFTVWDSGTNPDPPEDIAPANGPGVANHDPHEDPRNTYAEQIQAGAFLETGQVIDTCGGGPCFAAGYKGP
jgi:hypothetical protein